MIETNYFSKAHRGKQEEMGKITKI